MKFFAPLGVLFLFTLLFLEKILRGKIFFSHPDFSGVYYPFRTWFAQILSRGEFPFWNPYWGTGNRATIWASVPLDQYMPLQIFGFHQYEIFLAISVFCLLLASYAVAIHLLRHFTPGLNETDIRWLAVVPPLLFLLSPWTHYFVYYFLSLNSFLSLALVFWAMLIWSEKPHERTAYFLTLAGFVGGLGTKIEYTVFNLAFVVFLLISLRLSEKAKTKQLLGGFGLYLAGLFISVFSFYLLASALGTSYRAGALGNSWHWLLTKDMFVKIWENALDLNISWRHILSSPYVYFAGAGLYWGWREKDSWKLREIRLTPLFFLAFCIHYWARGESEIGEADLIRKAPLLLQATLGFLVGIAATKTCLSANIRSTDELRSAQTHSAGGLRPTQTRLICCLFLWVVFVFFMRNQGGILFSHLLGGLWMNTRDNYLIDFVLMILATIGLGHFWITLPQSRLSLFKRPLVVVLLFIILLPISYGGKFHRLHPLFSPTPEYQVNAGDPELLHLLRELAVGPQAKVDFQKSLSSERPSWNGAALLAPVPYAGNYDSLIRGSFMRWGNFHRANLDPTKSPFYFPYSEVEERKLPPHYAPDQLSYRGSPYDLIVSFAPDSTELRKFLGVQYVIGEKQDGPNEAPPGFRQLRSTKGLVVYQAESFLPTFTLLDPGAATSLSDVRMPLSMPLQQQEVPLSVSTRTNGFRIEADLSAPSLLFAKVTFDRDWIIRVNNQPVEPQIALDTFYLIPINQTGPTSIDFSFYPERTTLFACISVTGFFLFLLWTLYRIGSFFRMRRPSASQSA